MLCDLSCFNVDTEYRVVLPVASLKHRGFACYSLTCGAFVLTPPLYIAITFQLYTYPPILLIINRPNTWKLIFTSYATKLHLVRFVCFTSYSFQYADIFVKGLLLALFQEFVFSLHVAVFPFRLWRRVSIYSPYCIRPDYDCTSSQIRILFS